MSSLADPLSEGVKKTIHHHREKRKQKKGKHIGYGIDIASLNKGGASRREYELMFQQG